MLHITSDHYTSESNYNLNISRELKQKITFEWRQQQQRKIKNNIVPIQFNLNA